MFNNYNFDKNSNWVKFYKWIWGVNPVIEFKTMCPYFWSYVITIIILPIILVVKGIIYFIKKLEKFLVSSSMEKFQRRLDSLFTDEDYYKFYKSKCYHKHEYNINWDERDEIYKRYLIIADKRRAIQEEKNRIKREKEVEKEDNADTETSNPYLNMILGKGFAILLMICVVALASWCVYEFVHLFTMAEFLHFLKYFGTGVVGLVIAAGIIFGVFWLCTYIKDTYFCDRKASLVSKYLGIFFSNIGKALGFGLESTFVGFAMAFDMIKNTYKKQCPIIYWKDEEK